jgi:hypothetical protein
MGSSIIKTIFWVIIFSIAMAFLESAVVVYLRALYYPEGFAFPLKIIDPKIGVTEFIREIATLIMLLGIGIMSGRKNIERFAFFILSFAVWDIFYYVFLKLLLNWPQSLFTWDILFMIPVAWVGPVLAPVINSITMILLAFIIIYFVETKGKAEAGVFSWMLLILGSLVVILTYTLDYGIFMLQKMSFADLLNYNNSENIIKYTSEYVPYSFRWWLFLTGEAMHLIALVLIFLRKRLMTNKPLSHLEH